MITLKELNPQGYPTTPDIEDNLEVLCDRLNLVQDAYGSDLTVTSGLRSQAKQQQLIAEGKSKAPKSYHLMGEAADIYDYSMRLKAWVLNNPEVIEEIGLWMEDFSCTPSWVHFQIVPPKSGKRFFIP